MLVLNDYESSVRKRVLELLVTGAALLIVSPLMLAIGVAVKIRDGDPVLYMARRVGRNGKLFRLYKFRTMVVGADRKGPGITAARDVRITRTGAWLRRTKLDELPQLINVLVGDMGLVGPRPEDPRYVALYCKEQRRALLAKPGLTSPASLAFAREEHMLSGADWEEVYRHEILPAKLAMDLDYLERHSLWTDLFILLKTAGAVLRRK